MDGSTHSDAPEVVVIGAGIAGLCATLRLATLGVSVTLLESHDHVGGKIRTVPSPAGPIDAGPTVLTMRHVFDELFAHAGEHLEDHVGLIRQSTIARHFWPDGSRLDLFDDASASEAAVAAFAGQTARREFRDFSSRAARLFQAFDLPMMQNARPNLPGISAQILRNPSLLPTLAPFSTLKNLLHTSFSDPRLRQLFGRYATYVGGAPAHAPGLLALIWHAEASGVWAVEGGIHKLAEAVAALAARRGARIKTGMHVQKISADAQMGYRVEIEGHPAQHFDEVLFAGDPRALAKGRLGQESTPCAPQTLDVPRSFSARVHSFAARPEGPELAHHNVFFDSDPDSEFSDLMAGRLPAAPSIYVCAMDRGLNQPNPDLERFEIITNAPARPDCLEDSATWHPKIIQKMARFGLTFHPIPTHSSVTTETDFARMFPESLGALYGQSPHGLMSAFRRPTARTILPKFYLAGGGCHPGAGVPMAAISAKHAVEAILNDRISGSRSHPMVTPGGTLTA